SQGVVDRLEPVDVEQYERAAPPALRAAVEHGLRCGAKIAEVRKCGDGVEERAPRQSGREEGREGDEEQGQTHDAQDDHPARESHVSRDGSQVVADLKRACDATLRVDEWYENRVGPYGLPGGHGTDRLVVAYEACVPLAGERASQLVVRRRSVPDKRPVIVVDDAAVLVVNPDSHSVGVAAYDRVEVVPRDEGVRNVATDHQRFSARSR